MAIPGLARQKRRVECTSIRIGLRIYPIQLSESLTRQLTGESVSVDPRSGPVEHE